MQIYSTYKIKIKHYNHIFKETVTVYRRAVDFLTDVCLKEWDNISDVEGSLLRQQYVEKLCHGTKNNKALYDFDGRFYKFPSYLRRGAINEALGKVSSYKSGIKNWNDNPKGRKPSYPKAGYVYPSMYRTVMYNRTDTYKAQLKVYIHNTWDWITVNLKKIRRGLH